MNVAIRYRMGGSSASELVDSVEQGVREGHLPPGALLPPVRRLASGLGLSPTTVAAAYRTLRLRGLVTGAGRRGTRVNPRPSVLPGRPGPPPPGLRNLYDGNPDPRLLPPLPASRRPAARSRLYGEPRNLPELLVRARRRLDADGIPAGPVAVLGGGMDSIERVLQAHLRPGDRVAVEDPAFTGVLDLLGALGLLPEPMGLDERGILPRSLERALRAGARAVLVTPRAQNPTGAALDEPRVRELAQVLGGWPEVLLVEDDHAAEVAGAPARTLATAERARWAVVRTVSKSLGPDLRLAVVTGDETTVARVEGRQALGAGWVSHLLQATVATLWADPAVQERLRAAAAAYTERRAALLAALRREGVPATGPSGLNVWVPVSEEAGTVAGLAAAGWAVRAGERYRIQSPPAVRITAATLGPAETRRLAADVARAAGRRAGRTHPAWP
jgi:DNA-binding transcriptional MocR family regulator